MNIFLEEQNSENFLWRFYKWLIYKNEESDIFEKSTRKEISRKL